jgi:hypothetical protein
MGGGSLANIPKIGDKRFYENARKMERFPIKNGNTPHYTLGKAGIGYIIFSESGKLEVNLSDDNNSYTLQWINPSTGEITKTKKKISGKRLSSFEAPSNGFAVAWLFKD